MSPNSKEKILAAAKRVAQSHGYSGLNFRDLASEVGIKAASVYHYFPCKSDLGAAVAKRYWEDTAADLEAMTVTFEDPRECLKQYPGIFRKSLENGNRLCLCSFMAAENDDLPQQVKVEVQHFEDVNIAWLIKVLGSIDKHDIEQRRSQARAIFAAIAGAQLIARSRSNITIFDDLIATYRESGLLPG